MTKEEESQGEEDDAEEVIVCSFLKKTGGLRDRQSIQIHLIVQSPHLFLNVLYNTCQVRTFTG